MPYHKLFEVSSLIDEIIEFNYPHGIISYYSKKVIPDDNCINVVMMKNVPIKNITCSITINRNTDNA